MPDCRFDSPRFYLGDFWFQVSLDPGVIEVQAKGSTVEQYERVSARVQELLFNTAQEMGLSTEPAMTAGHIHIGIKESGLATDPVALRNVLADFLNHHEFAEGVLEWDPMNSRAISRQSEKIKDWVRGAFARFDGSRRTLIDAAVLIREIKFAYSQSASGTKFVAVNLDHVSLKTEPNVSFYDPIARELRLAKDAISKSSPEKADLDNYLKVYAQFLKKNSLSELEGTLEIRSIRGQRSIDDFIDLARLFEARMEFLRKNRGLLALGAWRRLPDNDQQVRRFITYVRESGLDWKDYRRFLPEWLVRFEDKALRSPCDGCECLFRALR
ncbi:MAG: hypothetical protein ACK5QT_09520 [Oligoflexia bacterium]